MAISRLYELAARQVDLMRAEKWEEAVAMMPEMEEAYRTAAAAIRG